MVLAESGSLNVVSKFVSLCVNVILSGASKLIPVKVMSTRFVPGFRIIESVEPWYKVLSRITLLSTMTFSICTRGVVRLSVIFRGS